MSKLLYTLPLIAALGLGTTALAQESETTGEAAAAEAGVATESTTAEVAAESDAAELVSELDMGQEVSEDPTYIKETYGEWQLKCFRSEAEEDPCQMFQLLKEEAGNPIAEFSIFPLPDQAQAAAGATIVVPLGTLLSEGIKMSVDGGQVKSYTFSFCSIVGCYARVGLTQADIDVFKRGASANLQIVPAQAPDQKVNITASLTGFTAAFENATTLEN